MHQYDSNISSRHHDEARSTYRLTGCIELIKQWDGLGGYVGLGKILDPSWIDSSVLRRWKSTCDKLHGLTCRSRFSPHQQSFPDRPTWLIDVWLQCLSHAPADADYVALSYVWGSKNSTTTSRANLEQLQCTNSLSKENEQFILPRTIRDAMVLTNTLGERYLWVDSLCIIQNDEKLRGEELEKMASIYANASVTIVAAQGTHADFGLRGLKSCQPRTLVQDITKINRDSRILKLNYDVLFQAESARWECDHGVWHEDREDVDTQRVNISHDPLLVSRMIFTGSIPQINLLLPILDNYMRRDLTYPEDRLRAFAGILKALEPKFHGGFVCGLPVLWLDTALLWQPYSVDYPRENDQSFGKLQPEIPSWSWASFSGTLDGISRSYYVEYMQRYGYTGLQSLRRESRFGVQTYPTIKWAVREHVGSAATVLQNTWFEYKRQAEEENELPPGWTKHDASASEYEPSWLVKNIYYTHDSDSYGRYSYPVPCRDDNTPMSPKGTLLSCHTKRGWLQLAEPLHVNIERKNLLPAYRATWIIMRTMDGTWAGALKYGELELGTDSISHTARDGSHDPIINHSIEAKTIELVAISRGCTVQSIPNPEVWQYACSELHHEEAPDFHEEKPYEFYNCLWIEWKEGIAYRKALGRVEKSIWEGLDLEEIDLILG
ncbi:hypothetical protein ACMFMG_009557 [Clarireedia jacksonii]